MFKILIAEDEALIAVVIRSIIQDNFSNCEIIGEAKNGRIALEMMRADPPDLVLADINMPVVNGLKMIEEARGFRFPGKFIIITGYKDFEFVQQAIRNGVEDYLLKPIEEKKLCEAIERTLRKIRDESSASQQHSRRDKLLKAQFLNRLTSGLCPQLSACNEAFDLQFAPGEFMCAIIKLDASFTAMPEDMKALCEHTFQAQIQPLCIDAFLMPQGVFWTLILNFKPEHRLLLEQAVTNAHQLLRDRGKAAGASVTMGLSDICQDFSSLNAAYRQAQNAIESRISSGQGSVIRYADLQNNRAAAPFVFVLEEEDLGNLDRALCANSPDELTRWFNRLYGQYMEKYRVADTETFQMLSFTNILFEALLDAASKLPKLSINRSTLLQQLQDPSSTEALRLRANELLRDVKKHIDETLNSTDLTITRATEYIRKHLSEPISLEDVAREVYLAPTYFSGYFKTKTGSNFKDYLLKLRIERAIELLRRKLKIQDIALQCGYTDVKHFCKVFKKSTGVTPSEFRRIYG